MTDFEALLAKAKLRESTVTLCLREDLVAQYERLDAQLRTADRQPVSLGDRSPAAVIAEQMEALRQEMLAAEQTFLMRAWPARKWAAYRDSMPARQKGQTDAEYAETWHAAVCDMVSRVCVDPVMTPQQVEQLVDHLSEAQWLKLSNAAWDINSTGQAIPFSVAASAILESGATK